MIMEKINIFGVNVFNIDFNEAKSILENFLKSEKLNRIYTPNTEIVMAAKKDKNLRDLINQADLVTADGIGLVIGSKLRKLPLKERVTGYDMSLELINIANRDNLNLYLLGAGEGVAKRAAENIKRDYKNINVVGFHNGFFKGSHNGYENSKEENDIIDEINSKKTDIIFVGLGFPKQEIFIDKNLNKINAKIIIGNGGVIDVLAGEAKRAPDIFIKLNLEWFYRLIKNPSRIKRQMAIPKFLLSIMMDKNSVKKGV